MSFVSLATTDDSTTLTDTGVDAINSNLNALGYPAGWTAKDATLAVIVLAVIAEWAADISSQASTLTAAAFRAYGTQLLQVPYSNPTSASVLATFTFSRPAPDSVSFRIDQGTTVIIDGQPFYVQAPHIATEGDTTAVVTLVASQSGTAYDNLGGVSTGFPRVQLNTGIDWVSTVVTQGITSGGSDRETDQDYQDRLARALRLYRLSVVTISDYPVAVMSDVCENATGVAVGRATAIAELYPDGRALSTGGAGSTTLTCVLTSGSATVQYAGTGNQVPAIGATITGTGVAGGAQVAATPAPTASTFTMTLNATASGSQSLTFSAMSGYGPAHLTCAGTVTSGSANVTTVTPPYLGAVPAVGARVTGTGIPAGALVAASPAPTSTAFTMTANATATAAGEAITVSSFTNVAKCVTTVITDDAGNALSATSMDAVQSWLGTLREEGFLPFVTAPTYNTVYITTAVAVLPGYDHTAVQASVQSALISWLSQAAWGNNLFTVAGGTPQWNNQLIVRYLSAVGKVESVIGVDYCSSLTLGFTASPSGTADLTMTGLAPLPQTSADTILVTTI